VQLRVQECGCRRAEEGWVEVDGVGEAFLKVEEHGLSKLGFSVRIVTRDTIERKMAHEKKHDLGPCRATAEID
jgi:hypothetical protein